MKVTPKLITETVKHRGQRKDSKSSRVKTGCYTGERIDSYVNNSNIRRQMKWGQDLQNGLKINAKLKLYLRNTF